MQFTYTYLKNAADRGIKIGTWKNREVYAAHSSSSDLKNYSSLMFVLYDDHNYLYCNGYIYGTVDKYGTVDEWSIPKPYKAQEEKRASTPAEKVPQEEPKEEPSVIGDVELGLLVDKTLNDVQTMGVNDLLKGFDYGL